MKKSFSQTIIAAALALPALAFAAATPIAFDMNGAAAGQGYTVDLLDWAPGNALAVGGNPGGGLTAGTVFQLLYQANLGLVSLGGAPIATAGLGGAQAFTAVAGVQEVVVSNTGSSAVFAMASAPVASATNFFKIYANQFGDNLAGSNFAQGTGTLVMSGHIVTINSSGYNTLGGTSNLDNFGTNDYPGISTLIGSGTTDLTVLVDTADASYFPGLLPGVVFSFTNTSQVTPFSQVDPSRQFSINGVANGGTASNTGPVNGVTQAGTDYNFQFQADGNSSFQTSRVPEPSVLALFGLALGVAGFASRRSNKKA